MQIPPTMLPNELRLFIDPPPEVRPRYDADGFLIGPRRRRPQGRRRLRALATRLRGVARRRGRSRRSGAARLVS